MNTVIIDIETKPDFELAKRVGYFDNIKAAKNIKDPDKIEAHKEKKREEMKSKLALNPHFAEVVVYGLVDEDNHCGQYYKTKTMGEKEILKEILLICNNWDYRLCTYNGKTYDIPVILHRAMLYNLEIDFLRFNELLKKYDVRSHLDLFNYFTGSLDLNSRIYLDGGKDSINFDTCSMTELLAHNKEDLIMTLKLYNKLTGGK